MTQASATIRNRRNNYENASAGDAFIVNLLRNNIEEILISQPAPSSGCVLDVGCGNQPFRERLEALGYIYMSLDVEQNIEHSVDYLGKIDESLPANLLVSSPFHLIVCTEVMEHVVDWETSFKNFSRLLAPGGKLLVTCPHFFRLHEEPHDFWRATPYALQYFGDRFGLNIVHQANAGDAWDVLGTFLASCSHSLPASQKITDRLLNRAVEYCRRFLLKLLIDQRLQASVHLYSPLYLSNIVVFEKL